MNGWQAGASRIEPLRQAALEDFAFADDDRLLIVVRERMRGEAVRWPRGEIEALSAAEFDERVRAAHEWPLQFTSLMLNRAQSARGLVLRTGAWGTAPVFLLAGRDHLRGEWDPTEQYARLPGPRLDEDLAAHFLASFATVYSRRTILRDLWVLTERAVARWPGEAAEAPRLTIDYPPAQASPGARTLKPGADVLSMFQTILEASMKRWMIAPNGVAASELSSGLDSGIVAAVASLLNDNPVRTYGILIPGEMGRHQQARRGELIGRFRFIDRYVEGGDFPPFSPGSGRLAKNRVAPWEECYYEGVEEMLKMAARDGVGTIFTGVGGDELLYPHWAELTDEEKQARLKDVFYAREEMPAYLSDETINRHLETFQSADRAPASLLPVSALEGVANGSALYLKNGIWPISPLCTPELVWFCRSLPRSWREGRFLERQFLRRLGCPPSVTHPAATENFVPVMQMGLRQARPLILEVFRDSRLADAGFLDAGKFLAAYEDYRQGRPTRGQDTHFYAALVLELTMRCVESRRTAS